MFVWVAVTLEHHKMSYLRQITKQYCIENQIKTTALELPQHVSLKISFKVDTLKPIDDLENILRQTPSFELKYKSIDYHLGLLWITFDEHEVLHRLHQQFDEHLLHQYNIKPHPFDQQYYFHSTLIYDDNDSVQKKIQGFKKNIEQLLVEETFQIKNYVIGTSESGLPGTYKVIQQGLIGEENEDHYEINTK